MLVLSRRKGERIRIGGDIVISITEIQGKRVQIAIEAPHSVPIRRSELIDRDQSFETPSRAILPQVAERVAVGT